MAYKSKPWLQRHLCPSWTWCMVEQFTVTGVDGRSCSYHGKPRSKGQGWSQSSINCLWLCLWEIILIVNWYGRAQSNVDNIIPQTGDLGECEENIWLNLSNQQAAFFYGFCLQVLALISQALTSSIDSLWPTSLRKNKHLPPVCCFGQNVFSQPHERDERKNIRHICVSYASFPLL